MNDKMRGCALAFCCFIPALEVALCFVAITLRHKSEVCSRLRILSSTICKKLKYPLMMKSMGTARRHSGKNEYVISARCIATTRYHRKYLNNSR